MVFVTEIRDHIWPWVDHKKGKLVTAKPMQKARESTGAGRYKKPIKTTPKMTKLRRVQKNRKDGLQAMGEAFLRDSV